MIKLELKDFWNDKDNNFVIDKNAVEKFNVWFDEYTNQNHYGIDEKILREYVKDKINSDSLKEDIYTVVTLLNSFYSTRMDAKECLKIANIFVEKHADILVVIKGEEQTENGINLFQKIIEAQRDKAKHVEFSFTTKYFSILSRFYDYKDKNIQEADKDLYPIYDSVVAKVLDYYFYNCPEPYAKEYYLRNKKAASSCNSTKKDYKKYVQLINTFGISPYKKLDNYLWTIGRLMSDKIRDKIKMQNNMQQKNENLQKKEPNEPSWFVLRNDKYNISFRDLMSDIIKDINENNVLI